VTLLYQREAALTLHDKRYRSSHYEGRALVPGFRIVFSVEHALDADSCKAEIAIYNLNEAGRAKLSQTKRPRVVLEAGYAGDVGVIYSGELSNVIHEQETTGWVTKIQSNTGSEAKRGILAASLPPGATVADAIEIVAKALGVNATRAIAQARAGRFDGSVKKFFDGKTFSGLAADAMTELGETLGFRWIIQNGELVILRPNDLLPDEALVLGPRTGLIGAPKIVINETQGRKTKMVGAKIQLMPRVVVGRQLMFTSTAFPGVYRIARAHYVGDTESGEWAVDTESSLT
jgi:hypothetical protein